MRTKLLIALFLILIGCAPSNVNLLKSEPDGKLQFEAEMSHEQVYRILAYKGREFLDWKAGEVVTDPGNGTVELVSIEPLFGWREVHLAAEVKQVSQYRSKVEILYGSRLGEHWAKKFRSWIDEAAQRVGPR